MKRTLKIVSLFVLALLTSHIPHTASCLPLPIQKAETEPPKDKENSTRPEKKIIHPYSIRHTEKKKKENFYSSGRNSRDNSTYFFSKACIHESS